MNKYLKLAFCLLITMMFMGCSTDSQSLMYTVYGKVSSISDNCIELSLGSLKDKKRDIFKSVEEPSITLNGEVINVSLDDLKSYTDEEIEEGTIMEIVYLLSEDGSEKILYIDRLELNDFIIKNKDN